MDLIFATIVLVFSFFALVIALVAIAYRQRDVAKKAIGKLGKPKK